MKKGKKFSANYYRNKAKRRMNPDIRKIRDGKVVLYWSDEAKPKKPLSRKLRRKIREKVRSEIPKTKELV